MILDETKPLYENHFTGADPRLSKGGGGGGGGPTSAEGASFLEESGGMLFKPKVLKILISKMAISAL